MEWKPTIGLEIHAELKTATKMFCNSKNDPDEKRPNVNVCPVCLAHPGTLPVPNQEAIKHVLRVGLALKGQLANFTEFDRKNYFYPDIPKGYQISQYKFPLVSGGELCGVKLTRIHLEEDTARSQHEDGQSLVDFNRAGVPLMEMVTEPVITSAKQAGDFAREFQLVLRYLGVAEANMEKGEMRVEANVSVSKDDKFGTKTEVKNINSFRAVEKAIEYEIARQIEVLESGGQVVQETRGWDDAKGATFSQRKKESSHDYRYFPDPDIPKFKLSEVPELSVAKLQPTIPELPQEKRERYAQDYGPSADEAGLQNQDIELFVSTPELAGFFEDMTKLFRDDKKLVTLASNYITNDLVKLLAGDYSHLKKLEPHFGEFIKMINAGEVSSRGAKDILAEMVQSGNSSRQIAEEKGLFQKSDEGALGAIVDKIIAANPNVVQDFKNGKQAALQFLVGQGMKESKGSANPGVLSKLIQEKLK